MLSPPLLLYRSIHTTPTSEDYLYPLAPCILPSPLPSDRYLYVEHCNPHYPIIEVVSVVFLSFAALLLCFSNFVSRVIGCAICVYPPAR